MHLTKGLYLRADTQEWLVVAKVTSTGTMYRQDSGLVAFLAA